LFRRLAFFTASLHEPCVGRMVPVPAAAQQNVVLRRGISSVANVLLGRLPRRSPHKEFEFDEWMGAERGGKKSFSSVQEGVFVLEWRFFR
jgi:hypothetical protein